MEEKPDPRDVSTLDRPAGAPLSTGETATLLGHDRYAIGALLGEGGMGVVVAATHLQLQERVALKFLLLEVSPHSETAARFLREAQAAALAGGGADAVREATAAEREAARELTRLAERVLEDGGRKPTPAVVERIGRTLRAAAVDAEAAALLGRGQLTGEVDSPGFTAVAAIAPPPSRRRPAKRAATDQTERRVHEQRVRRLQQRLEKLERRAEDAAARAERAEAEAIAAREAADAAAEELRRERDRSP
jgi:hypothetical protein